MQRNAIHWNLLAIFWNLLAIFFLLIALGAFDHPGLAIVLTLLWFIAAWVGQTAQSAGAHKEGAP